MTDGVDPSDRDQNRDRSPGGSPEAVETQFDWTETSPLVAVLRTVSIARNCDRTEMEPLAEYVDADALRAVVREGEGRAGDRSVSVSFSYDGHDVTVETDGTVVVRPTED